MLINPAVLLETLRSIPSVDEFQVAVRREDPSDPFSSDELVVRIAATSLDYSSLEQTIAVATQKAVQVRPRVEFTNALSIYDPGKHTKAKRFVDERDTPTI
jgi:phenylacetate-coenzyme A ligase PaaK-like adenylate-forming protein